MKDIRTDICRVGTGFADTSITTVVCETREIAAADQLEVVLDEVLASLDVGTEPRGVSTRGARDTLKVRVGLSGKILGGRSGECDPLLHGRRAADETNPLVVDAGDGNDTREVNLSNVLNGGIDVLDGVISTDVGEQVRWLDGVLSRTRWSEVVRSGN